MYTKVTHVRQAFWDWTKEKGLPYRPQTILIETKNGKYYRRYKKQSEYSADVRIDFIDFVEYLRQSGQINDQLVQKVTL